MLAAGNIDQLGKVKTVSSDPCHQGRGQPTAAGVNGRGVNGAQSSHCGPAEPGRIPPDLTLYYPAVLWLLK